MPPPVAPQEETLLQNTFILEPNKPLVVGLTNLREALILVLRMKDSGGERSQLVPKDDTVTARLVLDPWGNPYRLYAPSLTIEKLTDGDELAPATATPQR
jgi:hypothetical protein